MNFQKALAEKVVRGEKTATRRRVSDNPRSPWHPDSPQFRAGKIFAVCPGRGKDGIGKAIVSRRFTQPLCLMSPFDAWREGTDSLGDFRELWAQINGDYDPSERVNVVEFRAIRSTEEGRFQVAEGER